MIENKHVQKAEEQYEYLTGDAATRRIAYLREKKVRDEASGIQMATKLGQEAGEKKGRKEGKKEGRAEKQKEIAKKLKSMNVDMEIIKESTDLTEEEIKKL